MHHRAKDLSRQTLGYLTVVKYHGSDGRRSLWLLRCLCAKEIVLPASEITKQQKRGVQASCGCMKKTTIAARKRTHGMSRHKAFAIWRSMLDRCTLPTHQSWHNYGGRGVTVCEEWRRSFQNFWADMGPTYQEGLTLERKDNSAGYGPTNCVWATPLKQARNKRTNAIINTPWGLMTVAEAADRAGLSRSTLYYRVNNGVPDHRLFEAPDTSRKFTIW